jgi:hypothetical protein
MSEPHRPGPVPGPWPVPASPPATRQTSQTGQTGQDDVVAVAGAVSTGPDETLAGLPGRPVAEHVAVFEAEHDRLRRELSTIDQL